MRLLRRFYVKLVLCCNHILVSIFYLTAKLLNQLLFTIIKDDNISLFRSLKESGAEPLSKEAEFHYADSDGEKGFIVLTRKVSTFFQPSFLRVGSGLNPAYANTFKCRFHISGIFVSSQIT